MAPSFRILFLVWLKRQGTHSFQDHILPEHVSYTPSEYWMDTLAIADETIPENVLVVPF